MSFLLDGKDYIGTGVGQVSIFDPGFYRSIARIIWKGVRIRKTANVNEEFIDSGNP